MNRKYFVFVALIIALTLVVCPGKGNAENISAMVERVTAAVPASPAPADNMTGNGSISFETKNVEALYNSIKNTTTKYQASIRNLNIGNSHDVKYKYINMEVILDISQAAPFMNEIASLKEVTSQNYNQYAQREGNEENLNKELESLNKHLDRMVSSGKADSEAIKLIVSKIIETESRIKSLSYNTPMISKARININIQEKGYQNSRDNQNKTNPLNILIIVGVGIVCFILGLVARNLFCLRRKKVINE
jgi:hypothetical protein